MLLLLIILLEVIVYSYYSPLQPFKCENVLMTELYLVVS